MPSTSMSFARFLASLDVAAPPTTFPVPSRTNQPLPCLLLSVLDWRISLIAIGTYDCPLFRASFRFSMSERILFTKRPSVLPRTPSTIPLVTSGSELPVPGVYPIPRLSKDLPVLRLLVLPAKRHELSVLPDSLPSPFRFLPNLPRCGEILTGISEPQCLPNAVYGDWLRGAYRPCPSSLSSFGGKEVRLRTRSQGTQGDSCWYSSAWKAS